MANGIQVGMLVNRLNFRVKFFFFHFYIVNEKEDRPAHSTKLNCVSRNLLETCGKLQSAG